MSSPGLDARSPITATAAVLGRKWHPVIVRRLLEDGPLGFSALEASIPGVSGKVLSESLSDLQEKGVVERTVLREEPIRVEYSLTERGQALEGAVDELHRWGQAYLEETAGGAGPVDGRQAAPADDAEPSSAGADRSDDGGVARDGRTRSTGGGTAGPFDAPGDSTG